MPSVKIPSNKNMFPKIAVKLSTTISVLYIRRSACERDAGRRQWRQFRFSNRGRGVHACVLTTPVDISPPRQPPLPKSGWPTENCDVKPVGESFLFTKKFFRWLLVKSWQREIIYSGNSKQIGELRIIYFSKLYLESLAFSLCNSN